MYRGLVIIVDREESSAEPPRHGTRDDSEATADETQSLPARWLGASTVAVACWILGSAVAVVVVKAFDLNPLTVRGSVLPIAMGAVAGAVVLPLVLRWQSDRIVGAVAGLYAAWIGMVQLSALHGTPFAQIGEHNGDWIRLLGLANRLSTVWGSADAYLPGVPSEYPPLYPWVVGHLADLLNRPTWTMLKPVQITVLSATVVVAFVLWNRLVSAPVALAMAAFAPAVFTWGYKDYEIITLGALVPYLLATFADRPRSKGGMHWLPAGIIGGLFATTYVGYLLFASGSVLALIGARLLRPNRGRYLLHVLGVLVTAAVVASWYLGPLAIAYLTQPRQQISDTYPSNSIASDPVPTLSGQPAVFVILGVLGLVGMLWYRRRTWWAQPILLMLGGVAAYWGISMLSEVFSGHTLFLPKAPRLVNMILIVSGVLTVAQAGPPLIRRYGPRAGPTLVRSASIGAVTLLIFVGGITCWQAWTPGVPRGFVDFTGPSHVTINGATKAHLELLPNGQAPQFTPSSRAQYSGALPLMPADLINRDVEQRLGPDARPMSLSADARIYMYVHWYGYLQGNGYASSSLELFNDRVDELRRLAAITDPTTFAKASAHTRFGGIDVFLLRKAPGKWRYGDGIEFAPSAFSGGAFEIVDHIPSGLVLAIRRPG